MTLEDGDELILATDGVFDQLDEEGGPEAVARAWAGRGSVFVLLRELLERSLAKTPQKDDLTVVWVERRDPERRARVLRFPSPPNGGPADV
jgi:serine/threonine protein phosphatase PrpC